MLAEEINETESQIMQIIIYAGDAKKHAYDSLRDVNDGNYENADKEMNMAHESLVTAHNAQTSLLQNEARGKKTEITALFVHAQDHLMTSITEINLIEQIVELRKVVNTLLEGKNNQ